MKRLTFIVAMLFVFALLMADVTASVAPRNENTTQERYPNRDIFYSEDFESGATGWTHWDGAVSPNNWHIYDNGDAQGNVWWMGDPALASGGNIGGYYDHQYLVLDTPVIPISTGNCTLTFMMRHGLEDPGVSEPYDGWDSFNLRISTNNGISYTVIPDTTAIISPVYDFENSYAFGSEHGEGLGVPAWGGVREWTAVTVDLTDYLATPNVKIRFAFASDPAYSTADDPTLYGVMVDDIALASYTNNGVDDGQMTWTSLVPTAGDFWHVAEDATAPSPTHIMTCVNNAGTYVPFMLDYLESPTISLPGTATQIIADFQLKATYYDPGVFPDVDYFGWEIWHNGSWHYMSNITDDPDGDNYVYSSAPENWAS
ncbi:MAG: T9SS type A sorting domain-containing protein, partial [Candidatus Syntrophosphaera sp.]